MNYRTMDATRLNLGCNGELDRVEQWFQRFEPVTVGAAARVLERREAGVISAGEAEFYLRELLALDAHAGLEALPMLLRAAQRRPYAGHRPGRVGRFPEAAERNWAGAAA